MTELLQRDCVVMTLGPGGVGKTTIAAALGVAAARAHLTTALITVDPAPRLRDALGLANLGGKPTYLGHQRLRAAGLDHKLRLAAMMLDVSAAWDELIVRFATPPARERILNNRFYRQLTEQFAGAETYAALATLYDLHDSKEFEALIVDTPPAADAFDFLRAPARLSRLLDLRAARWLFTPPMSASRLAMGVISRAARFVLRELEHFAGAGALAAVSDFFVAAQRTLEQITEQMHKTEALLHSGAVSFVLVTTAEEERLRQTRQLIDEMKAEGLVPAALVINRFGDARLWEHLMSEHGAPMAPWLEAISSLRAALASSLARAPGLEALVRALESYRLARHGELERVARWAHHLPPSLPVVAVPEIWPEVRGLRQVARVAEYLAGPRLRLVQLARRARATQAGASL